MKIKDLFIYILFIIIILLICFHSDFISKGFFDGLKIWYNNLVPVILPFLLISGLFMSLINFDETSKTVSLILLFVCGLCCGYPIGAIVINKLYSNGIISKNFAHAVMPLCNNISPMFLVGYIYNSFTKNTISLPYIIALIYIPQLLYFIIYMIICFLIKKVTAKTHVKKNPKIFSELAASDDSSSNIIENSITTITVIGVYIAVFSVISNIIFEIAGDNIYLKLISCYMEITKGIPSVNLLIKNKIKKTAMLLSLTSFGGVSSLLQSMHILKQTKLSFLIYSFGKLICCITTYVLTIYILS